MGARGRIYWGWYVIAGTFLILSVNYGARYCFGVFVKPLSDEYGWSRAVVSTGASLNILAYSVCAVFLGRVIDRIAPLRLITAGALLAGLSFALMGLVKTPLQFYIVYGLLIGAGSAGMGLVVLNCSAAKWFIRKRGTAIGISTMGVSFGTILLNPAAGFIVKSFDWRAGFMFISALFLAALVLAQFLMRKESPESCGLLPDGETDPANVLRIDESRRDPSRAGISYAEMFADRRFWIIGIGFGLAVMALMSVFVHQIAYAQDRGVEKLAAAASLGVVGLAGFLGQFFFGWLSDRISDVKYSAVIGVMFMLAGLVILLGADSIEALYVYSFTFGFGYGCLAPMLPIVIADRFGQSDMAPVYGMITFLLGIGGCIGPLAAGMIYDRCGSYDLVWLSDIGILAFAALSLAALKMEKQINL